MKIIGHRGAAGLALENTLQGIRIALDYPLSGVEVDVRRTKDRKLVLLHDAHTGRVSNETVYLHDVTLAELRKIKLHNGERIPTLDEVFKLVGERMPIMLDIKDGGIQDEIGRLLKKYPSAQTSLSGRHYDDLKKIHEAWPKAVFLMQHHYDPTEIIHRATMYDADGICLNMWLMNPLNYRLTRRRRLAIYVYTINHRWILRLFEKLYPEAVIITNHPERLL